MALNAVSFDIANILHCLKHDEADFRLMRSLNNITSTFVFREVTTEDLIVTGADR